MKVKALLLGLMIAAATALSYTAISDTNAEQAIERAKIKPPTNG